MITLLVTQSCSSDLEPMVSEINKTDTSVSHLVVKIGDHFYETDVVSQGDTVKYLNEEYEMVYRTQIAPNPDIAAVFTSDESGNSYIEYFISESQLLEQYEFLQPEDMIEAMPEAVSRGGTINLFPDNRPSIVLAHAELYDDKNFDDTRLLTYVTTTWMNSVARLKDLGFNDKTSSIKVFNQMRPDYEYTISSYEHPETNTGLHRCTHKGSDLRPVLKCYQDSDYKGSVIYCIASPTGSSIDHTDTDLKKIGWNDKISAITWFVAYDFSVFEGDPPLIPAHPDC